MKTSARVIVTYDCNRKCPGCCNTTYDKVIPVLTSHAELIRYDDIVITGGEPMLFPDEVLSLIKRIRNATFGRNIYLYSSFWNGTEKHLDVLRAVNGITFTLHAECNDKDVKALKDLSRDLISSDSNRLIIDNRVYDRYDLSNIDLSRWNVIRKLQWKDECEPALNEDLYFYNIKSLLNK
jgi:pyruvate-formate lyase-activating enzyme